MDILSCVTSALIAFSLLYPLPSMHEDQLVLVYTLALNCESVTCVQDCHGEGQSGGLELHGERQGCYNLIAAKSGQHLNVVV